MALSNQDIAIPNFSMGRDLPFPPLGSWWVLDVIAEGGGKDRKKNPSGQLGLVFEII